jgi:tRNA nucleotidyltransferase/poly(A) polymerase
MSRSVYSAYLVWLGEHPLESALKVANRLRLPGEFQKSLRAYNLLNLDGKSLGSCNPSAFTHRLEEVSRIVLFALECATTDKVFKQRLVQYRTQWSKVKISINGGDLKKLGLRPGPAYRRILESLKNAWIDGKINSPSEEQKLLRHLVGLEKERSPD